MIRVLGLAFLASTALSLAAHAATPERVRGTVTAVTANSVTVHTADKDVTVSLGDNTKYLKVVKSSLNNVDKDAYIGTATKEVGGKQIALEVLIFPPAMKGTGDGHYGWDRIRDTTLQGSGTTSSSMTNGSVTAVQSSNATVNSTMTNGSVTAATGQGASKTITVQYKGGEQVILVPPTAPIVGFEPNTKADLTVGKVVFIGASNDEGKLSANAVAIGTDGVPPPM